MFSIITNDIPFDPAHRNVQLPLFLLQVPQKTLVRFGLDTSDWKGLLKLLLKVEIAEASLINTFIDLASYRQILTIAVRLFGADRFLAAYIADIQPHHFGPVGIAMTTAPTLDDALSLWTDNMQAMVPVWSVSRRQTRDEVILVFRQTLDMGDVRDFYEELVLLLTRKLLLQVAGEGAAIRVTLPHRGCCPQELYMSQFGVLPEMNSQEASIIIPRNLLGIANEGYSPLTYQKARDEAELLAENARNCTLLSSRLRYILVEGTHCSRFYHLDDVADRLNLSVRTLTRRLHDEGTSFREIQCEARLEMAKRQLRESTVPIKVVSANAGFSNLSAFSRAFRKYAGVTPSEYREQSVASA